MSGIRLRLHPIRDGIECWFCDTCSTMTLLRTIEEGRCAQAPPRADCPAPEHAKVLRTLRGLARGGI